MGKYAYGLTGQRNPTAFNAILEEAGGGLTGETIEPNTFRPDAGDTLVAGLTGSRDGSEVFLVKTYSDFRGERLHYHGTADRALKRITGTWHFPSRPQIRGTFVMVRQGRATARSRQRQTAVQA